MLNIIIIIISNFDRSPLFRSNFNILIDLTFCTQISTFWSIPTLLHSNVNFLIDSPLFTQNTTFWTIWWLALKFQHFDWFPILFSISISWSIPYFSIKFQHFDRFPLGNKISAFDQSPLIRSNFNILIDAALLYSNFNILINFDIFHSNFNILIDSHLIALKRQLFDWFPNFSLKYQHFDRIDY